MRKKGILCTLLLVGCLLCGGNQSLARASTGDSLTSAPKASPFLLDYLDVSSLWFGSGNSAGRLTGGPVNWGTTSLGFSSRQGDYRHPQTPESVTEVSFRSERYQRLNQLMVYGRFEFDQTWEQNRNWSDIMDPFRGTPYVLADSIGGDWKKQEYSLLAGIASVKPDGNKLQYGFELGYQLGVGAKTLDPRPLANTYQLELLPSLIWHAGEKQKWGLSLNYRKFKEDVSMTIRRAFSSHNLYRFKGLAMYDAAVPISSGYARYYSGRELGFSLQNETMLTLFGKEVQWLSEIGFSDYQEETVDGGVQPMPAGDWKTREIDGSMAFFWSGAMLHKLRLGVNSSSGEGIEYHTVYNPVEMGYDVSFSGKVFEQSVQDLLLSYDWIKPSDETYFRWKLSLLGRFSSLSKSYRYIHPSEQEIQRLDLSGRLVISPSENWQLAASLGLYYTLAERLAIVDRPGQEFVTQTLLIPGHAFDSSDYLSSGISVKRLFSLPSAPKSSFYGAVDLSGQWSNLKDHRNRTLVGISLGAYY